jgi:hypothetical protein
MYSNKPAGSIVVTDLITQQHLDKPEGKRKLNDAGMHVVDLIAEQVADQVDILLGKGWSRRKGAFTQVKVNEDSKEEVEVTCSCGSGIPIQKIIVNGKKMTIVALPLIFQNFWEAKKQPAESVLTELAETVKVYNEIDPADEAAIWQEIYREYQTFWNKQEANHE